MKKKNWIDYLSDRLNSDNPVFGITAIVIVLFSIIFFIWFAELIIKSLE